MLAVTMEATVRLVPQPKLARCIMTNCDDIRKASDAVAAVIAARIIPAGLMMMDKPMTAAVEDIVHAGYDLDAAAILENSVALGGTVAGEYGVGVENLSSMCVQFSPEERTRSPRAP